MEKAIVCLLALLSLGLSACGNSSQPRSILKTYVDESGYLIVVYTDGTSENAGYVKGEKGEQGTPGVDGTNGKDGADGKDGLNGQDGKDGRDGLDGQDGKDGKDGIDGKDGVDGKDGQDGRDGLDGKDGRDGQDGKDSITYVETIKTLPLTFYEDYTFTQIKANDELQWYAFSISSSPYLGIWGFPIFRSTLSQFPTNDLNHGIGDLNRVTLSSIGQSYGLTGYHNLTGQQTVYVCGKVTKASYTDTYYGGVRQYWVYIDATLVVEANYLVAHYTEF